MRALVLTAIRELRVLDLPDPAIARPDDVLLEVRACGVCGSDLHGYTGRTGRRVPPLIMGHEATAVVRATGAAVPDLPPGTRVALHPIDRRDGVRRVLGMDAPGAYATRLVWPAGDLHRLPAGLSFEAGALAEPLAVAVHAVATADPAAGASAAVVGAGPIGLLIAALLKHRGVAPVVVTDLSDERLAVARRLGVDAALRPDLEDPAATARALTGGRGVDVAFEAVGIGATVAQAHAAVRDGGTVVWVGNNLKTIELDMQQVVTRELRVLGSYAMSDRDFSDALALLAAGAIPTEALVDRHAVLDEGPELFETLLASPDVVKCLFVFGG